MKLESQVASLALSRRLKELGVRQESIFQWFSVKGDREKDCYVSSDDGDYGYKICSAFTVAELGEMVGRCINDVSYTGTRWRLWLDIGKEDFADTEADARAKMLCYLIENGLIPELVKGGEVTVKVRRKRYEGKEAVDALMAVQDQVTRYAIKCLACKHIAMIHGADGTYCATCGSVYHKLVVLL